MEIIRTLAENFTEERHTLKLLEEMAELSEVLLKRLTKSEELKPPVEKVVEEMGDVVFRMECLIKKLNISMVVNNRYIEKGEQVAKWYADKYPAEKPDVYK